jgi:magnesium transporter
MSVIAAYYYNEGKRIREIAIDERVQLDKSRSGFCWIALHEPTADELHTLQATYHLHPLAIDNAMHPLCPPKLEVYNDELYVVAQTAELVGDQISYGKTAIFTGHNHLISVRHGNAGALGNLREQLEASPALLGKGVDYVLHAILHRIVDQYLPIFEMIEDDVLAMERRSLDDFLGREEVARISFTEIRTHALPTHARRYGRTGQKARSRAFSLHQRRSEAVLQRCRRSRRSCAVHGRRPPSGPVHGL